MNAIRDAEDEGLGEVPGRRTSLFCQEDLIPEPQTGITVPGIGPEIGNLARFLPDAGKMATVSGMTQSADDREERAGNKKISDRLTPPQPPPARGGS